MGPFKCPDCGTWWAGVEHRCPPTITTTGSGVVVSPTPYTVQDYRVCTCGQIPPNYVGDWFCPVHISQWTVTSFAFGDTSRAWFPAVRTNVIAGPQTTPPRGVS